MNKSNFEHRPKIQGRDLETARPLIACRYVAGSRRMKVRGLDHLVLTVRDIEKTLSFYKSVLGMEPIRFGEGRVALNFGRQKINLHQAGKEIEPTSGKPTPGSADLCFLTSLKPKDAMDHVVKEGVEIIEGPVKRTGANGSIISFYFRAR